MSENEDLRPSVATQIILRQELYEVTRERDEARKMFLDAFGYVLSDWEATSYWDTTLLPMREYAASLDGVEESDNK